jgi:hypothetical protein
MDIEDAPGTMQMELTDMWCNSNLEDKYKNVLLLGSCSKYNEKEKFPAIRAHALF